MIRASTTKHPHMHMSPRTSICWGHRTDKLQKPSWHCRQSLKELKTLGMDSGSPAAAGMELGYGEDGGIE